MAAKFSWIARAGALVVGGILILGGARTWAADAPAGNGQLQPVPEQSTQSTTEADDYMDESLPYDDGEGSECVDFCGLPCCSPPGRFWLRADYLMWWTNGMELPPLVTTSPIGTPVADAGVLPAASVLYGDSTVCTRDRSGWRTTFGLWLDNCHTWGVEGDYFALGREATHYSQYSTGNPILARPFYDVENIKQNRELVSYPDAAEGTVSVDAKDYFNSAGVALSYNLCCCDGCDGCDTCNDSCCLPMLSCCRSDLILGYRYYRYSDSILIAEDVRILEEGPTENYRLQVEDKFRARNVFHGSEIGLRNVIYRGRWSFEILTKIALGRTRQTVNIDGQTIVTPPDSASVTRDGGVLAVRSNEGTYTNDEFTMIPQLGIDLGYQINENWRAYVGYNILYWACIVHASEQIDLNVDPRNIPEVQDPALPFPEFPGKKSSFWAQGLNVGLEMRF
ncbi:MAG: BBP7 family outer membrane beta-barrel protein [Pirellulales bacterium]|nr:BBP7 family outer membrane beta-barrel protein [Pirellulales bacterium]